MILQMKMNDELSNKDISELILSNRSYNGLKRGGISTFGELIEKSDKLDRIHNLGAKSVVEIRNVAVNFYIENCPYDSWLKEFWDSFLATCSQKEYADVMVQMINMELEQSGY